jgi:hypothetical protein
MRANALKNIGVPKYRRPDHLAMVGILFSFLFGWATLCLSRSAAQTLVDEKAPCACAITAALDCRYEADAREAEFDLVVPLDDLKDNVGAFPLSPVFDKVSVPVQHMPYDLLARHES